MSRSHPSLSHGPVSYGFEPEDLVQERALGTLMAHRLHPDNGLKAWDRCRSRIGRHREKEADYKRIKDALKIEIRSKTTVSDEQMYASVMVHEILDLLPLAVKENALQAMLLDDGRKFRKIGREIREAIKSKGGD